MLKAHNKTPQLLAMLLCVMAVFSSCSSQKDVIAYFQDAYQLPDSIWSRPYDMQTHLMPNDELEIVVTAVDQAAAASFNKSPYTRQENGSSSVNTLPQVQTYVVNERGEIVFPVLGTIQVKGLTTLELQDYLSKRIGDYIKDPVVNVNMMAYKVTVLGAVANPGVCEFKGNRATILEAIGQRGDLTVYGERSNVMLIRERDGQRSVHQIDLTSAESINSPYYYLQQNDVIYVAPNQAMKDSSKYNNLKSYNISLVGTIVSCVSVLTSLFIAIWK